MTEDQDINNLRVALGRSLPARLEVDREIPERLLALLRQLEQREQAIVSDAHAAP